MVEFEQAKLFSKEEEKTTKKKKKVLRIAGRGKNARLFRFFIKNFIETQAKMNRKKTGTLALVLQFYCALALWGDRLNLSFFFGLE